MPILSDHCAYHGARPTKRKASLREMAAAFVCGSFLPAVLALAGFIGFQWMERQESRIVNYAFWDDRLKAELVEPAYSNWQ